MSTDERSIINIVCFDTYDSSLAAPDLLSGQSQSKSGEDALGRSATNPNFENMVSNLRLGTTRLSLQLALRGALVPSKDTVLDCRLQFNTEFVPTMPLWPRNRVMSGRLLRWKSPIFIHIGGPKAHA
jgi:hypothetical protein